MWYVYTVEYYPAVKKNEIMSFAAIWMDLEIIILSKLGRDKYDIAYPPASSCEPIPYNNLHVSPVLVLFLWRTLTNMPFSGSDPYYPTWTRALDLGKP